MHEARVVIIGGDWWIELCTTAGPSPRLDAPIASSAPPAPSELLEDEPPTSTWASPLEGWEEPTMSYPSVRES